MINTNSLFQAWDEMEERRLKRELEDQVLLESELAYDEGCASCLACGQTAVTVGTDDHHRYCTYTQSSNIGLYQLQKISGYRAPNRSLLKFQTINFPLFYTAIKSNNASNFHISDIRRCDIRKGFPKNGIALSRLMMLIDMRELFACATAESRGLPAYFHDYTQDKFVWKTGPILEDICYDLYIARKGLRPISTAQPILAKIRYIFTHSNDNDVEAYIQMLRLQTAMKDIV